MGSPEIQNDVPLWRYTTLKIGGNATHFIQPKSLEELVEAVNQLKKTGEPWYVLGGGSNMLVSSQGVKGTVIRTAMMTRITHVEPDVIEADAGTRLPHLAKSAGAMGLSGFEFAVGIPGTVGGGVIMNAGAHGSSMSEVVESVTVFDTSKSEIVVYDKEECGFVYRRCNLDPAVHIILSTRFRCKQERPEIIAEAIKHNEDYRLRTQPIGFPNAGSTFKNPEPKRSAGMLLDQAGAKNMKEGGASVSALHANFVINNGGATSEDVTHLLKRMQDTVYSQFDVRMHPEWKTLGEFAASEKEVWQS